MVLYFCVVTMVLFGQSLATTDSADVGEPGQQEMWLEIQRLRSLINQETDLRLAFEQNFLTHLNTVVMLEKNINNDLNLAKLKEEGQETRLSNLENKIATTINILELVNNRTNALTSDVEKAVAKGCLSGYENVHTSPPPSWPQTIKVTFSKQFDEIPVVTHGIVLLDSSAIANVRSNNEVSAISKTGFTLKMDTWANTVQYGVGIAWMACPKLN